MDYTVILSSSQEKTSQKQNFSQKQKTRVDKLDFENYNFLINKKKGCEGMGKAKEKGYSPEQISDAQKMCELINSVPEGKRSIVSVVMLAYMNGMEAGMVYAKDAKAAT